MNDQNACLSRQGQGGKILQKSRALGLFFLGAGKCRASCSMVIYASHVTQCCRYTMLISENSSSMQTRSAADSLALQDYSTRRCGCGQTAFHSHLSFILTGCCFNAFPSPSLTVHSSLSSCFYVIPFSLPFSAVST